MTLASAKLCAVLTFEYLLVIALSKDRLERIHEVQDGEKIGPGRSLLLLDLIF